MYDPKIGQFPSEDPIGFNGDPGNVYRYVKNQPTTLTDPTGLAPPSQQPLPGVPYPYPPPDMDIFSHAWGQLLEDLTRKWPTTSLPPIGAIPPGSTVRLPVKKLVYWHADYINSKGCFGLAQVRLGIYSDVKNLPGSRERISMPHMADGVRLFGSIQEAFDYSRVLFEQGENPRLFAVQTSLPLDPAPAGFAPTREFPSEVHPQTVQLSSYNYCTLHWKKDTRSWYWEYMANARGDIIRVYGLPTYPVTVYGVIDVGSNGPYTPEAPW